MDPIQYAWMYASWLQDTSDDIEVTKNAIYLLASFSHPEAVQKLINDKNKQFSSSDEDFEESSKMVFESNKKQSKKSKRRRIKA